MTTVPFAVEVRSQPQLRRVAAVAGHANVVIDVSALDFCDSAGWHALERCCADGATVFGAPPCLRRLFYLIRHAHLLPAELHELRGLEPAAHERLPTWTTRTA